MELKGAEILAAGTWNGTTFTTSDLDAIVSSFATLGLRGRIPLKIGHDADHTSDAAPALGWVDNLRREGNTLLADFVSIPAKLYDAIKEGLYKHVSVELLGNVKASTRVIPWVLDAVAILGATAPAVGILKDLQSLTLARKAALRFGSRHTVRRVFSQQSTEVKGMEKAEVEALIASAVKATETKLSATVDELKVKLSAAEEATKTAKAEAAKVALKAHRDSILGKFEAAIAADTLDPKHRESFKKLTGVDDDARVLSIDLASVESYIAEHKKAPAKKKLTREAEDRSDEAALADEDGNIWAADVVAHRVRKLALTRNIKATDFEARIALADEVLRADKDLAEAYRDHAHAPTADAA